MQVRANEATTIHEENNYGFFSLSLDTGTAGGSNLILYVMEGIAILGMYLQHKSWKASRTTKCIPSKRRQGKTHTASKAMRSRRVVLNDSPNRNARTGSHRGKTASMPMHDAYTWRNPGGPIGSPAGDQTAGFVCFQSC